MRGSGEAFGLSDSFLGGFPSPNPLGGRQPLSSVTSQGWIKTTPEKASA